MFWTQGRRYVIIEFDAEFLYFKLLVKTGTIFTVRRYALHGLSYGNSVCPSVTLVHCVHILRPTIMIFSPYGSPIILVSGHITFIPKFEAGHPERER